MDRIGGVGHQHDVARRGDRLGHVGEALLRAERRDDLRLGIELDAEAARVIAGLRAAQAGDALRGGIAVGARLADRLDELVDHVLGRGQVGIAHAEIDDVGAGGAGLGLELVDLLEDVRRQAPHAVKVAHRSRLVLGCNVPFVGRSAPTWPCSIGAEARQTAIGYCWAASAAFDFGFFCAACCLGHRLGGRRKGLPQRVVPLLDRVEVALDALSWSLLRSRPRRLGRRLEDRNVVGIGAPGAS